jgi:hypothetical protein
MSSGWWRKHHRLGFGLVWARCCPIADIGYVNPVKKEAPHRTECACGGIVIHRIQLG